MKKTPLQQVNERFGDKDKLVDKLTGMLDRDDEEKDEFKARLLSMANSKLLRLYNTHVEIADRFGDKDKLVDAILELMKKRKDLDYADKLGYHTPVRLLAMHREQEKKARRAQ
ncbi:MAG: hypothetical protein KAI47_10515 [Deltaproteobacteria bacterium]|nr:hypothetical protein [Deltaproteobacteria bacterium]